MTTRDPAIPLRTLWRCPRPQQLKIHVTSTTADHHNRGVLGPLRMEPDVQDSGPLPNCGAAPANNVRATFT
ncbi:unnamed protein product [Knipowitschia caucasica]